MQTTEVSEWGVAVEVWAAFVARHPELALRPGRWQLVNFMRRARPALLAVDAIRKANSRHWIAHRRRFNETAFEILTSSGEAL
jgi:hypothetical protein